ncbi:hypothetical protein EJ06DRAFT_552958 [Trichodelitschia bisporula]|uniref:Uncharacterized protein n=1 Tax=Trichodelitschia bisporula TaxID=703511 RepID=A0A6G1IBD1_9PEZI|nr:hypothetical protein EJ06DRAFT_552958 [Trichodelitschia bisporula]
MPALALTHLMPRAAETLHLLEKRKKNWAAREPGVILVFAIKLQARKQARAARLG